MKIIILSSKFLVALQILVCFFPISQGITQTKSNLEVIKIYLVDYPAEVIDSSIAGSGELQLKLEQEDDFGMWWKGALREFLIEKKVTINGNLNQSASSTFQLVLERAQIKISYFPKKRKFFFKTSSYQRKITGLYSFVLIDKQGNISLSRLKEFNYEDEISASAIKSVENQHFLFTSGTKMESKFIKRLVEPVIITATTAGVVYLFYTLRSGT